MSGRDARRPGRDLWQERVDRVRAPRDARDRAAGIAPSGPLTSEEIEELRRGVVAGLERHVKRPRPRTKRRGWIMRKLFGF